MLSPLGITLLEFCHSVHDNDKNGWLFIYARETKFVLCQKQQMFLTLHKSLQLVFVIKRFFKLTRKIAVHSVNFFSNRFGRLWFPLMPPVGFFWFLIMP